jgi:hypothetical protein
VEASGARASSPASKTSGRGAFAVHRGRGEGVGSEATFAASPSLAPGPAASRRALRFQKNGCNSNKFDYNPDSRATVNTAARCETQAFQPLARPSARARQLECTLLPTSASGTYSQQLFAHELFKQVRGGRYDAPPAAPAVPTTFFDQAVSKPRTGVGRAFRETHDARRAAGMKQSPARARRGKCDARVTGVAVPLNL